MFTFYVKKLLPNSNLETCRPNELSNLVLENVDNIIIKYALSKTGSMREILCMMREILMLLKKQFRGFQDV